MFPLRNVLRGSGGAASSTGRAALQAVATTSRAPESTLEAEQWVAADMEGPESPIFSEPLTIDELKAARDDIESSFNGASAQGAPALLPEDDEATRSRTTSAEVDADQQMQTIQQQTLRATRTATSDYLDAALALAADHGVQRALFSALLSNPDAQAALQRGFAKQGLSIDMQRLQTAPTLLPPSAAALATGSNCGVVVTDVTGDSGAEHSGGDGDSLKDAFERITAEVVQRLARFGGRVQSVLHAVLRRWRRRLEGLFNPGKAGKNGEMESGDDDRVVAIMDGILAASALFITVALFKRVPLLRP